MMEINIITLVLVGIFALMLGYWFGKKRSPKMVNGQAEEKKKNMEAILGLMESGNQPLTNNQVEQMLGISDATAERYLDELEREGKIKQVGKTGRDVFYEKV